MPGNYSQRGLFFNPPGESEDVALARLRAQVESAAGPWGLNGLVDPRVALAGGRGAASRPDADADPLGEESLPGAGRSPLNGPPPSAIRLDSAGYDPSDDPGDPQGQGGLPDQAAPGASAQADLNGFDFTDTGGQEQPDPNSPPRVDSSAAPTAAQSHTQQPPATAALPAGQTAADPAPSSTTDQAVAAAKASEAKWGIPAIVTLGQWALESGHGKSMPVGSNNPFGIKARPGEPFVLSPTTEYDRNGRKVRIMGRFRKYASLAEAFNQHGRLLATTRAYAKARQNAGNPGKFADALTGVYASDSAYGAKLRKTMQSMYPALLAAGLAKPRGSGPTGSGSSTGVRRDPR